LTYYVYRYIKILNYLQLSTIIYNYLLLLIIYLYTYSDIALKL